MPIIVRYNNDVAFRRTVAFRRSYRAKNFRMRMWIELFLMAVSLIATVLMLATEGGRQMPVVFLYVALVLGMFLLARFIRTVIAVRRITEGERMRWDREFFVDETGFSFGPLDTDGTMIETKWREVNKAYITDDAIYILCMDKKHWAAMDRSMLEDGSWEQLVEIISQGVGKRRTVRAVC